MTYEAANVFASVGAVLDTVSADEVAAVLGDRAAGGTTGVGASAVASPRQRRALASFLAIMRQIPVELRLLVSKYYGTVQVTAQAAACDDSATDQDVVFARLAARIHPIVPRRYVG